MHQSPGPRGTKTLTWSGPYCHLYWPATIYLSEKGHHPSRGKLCFLQLLMCAGASNCHLASGVSLLDVVRRIPIIASRIANSPWLSPLVSLVIRKQWVWVVFLCCLGEERHPIAVLFLQSRDPKPAHHLTTFQSSLLVVWGIISRIYSCV